MLHDNKPPASEVAECNVFSLVCYSARKGGGSSHVTITHDALELTIKGPPVLPPPPRDMDMFNLDLAVQGSWDPPPPDMFKLVTLPTPTHLPPPSYLPPPPKLVQSGRYASYRNAFFFIMNHVRLESRQLAFYWNTFLFRGCEKKTLFNLTIPLSTWLANVVCCFPGKIL